MKRPLLMCSNLEAKLRCTSKSIEVQPDVKLQTEDNRELCNIYFDPYLKP